MVNGTGVAIVVEDDYDVGEFLKLSLERKGYFVHVYSDVNIAETELVDAFTFDVAILDATCPDRSRRKEISFGGFYGLDLAQRLQGLYPSARIFCTSGYDLSDASSTRGVPFLQKPLTLNDIDRMIGHR